MILQPRFLGKKLARGNSLDVFYLLDPKRTVFLTNMVRTSMLGKLRMRKLNTKTIGRLGKHDDDGSENVI